MVEYYARADYNYNGGGTTFSVPFPYIDKSHVKVIINEDRENPITTFTWLTDSSISLSNEINTGDIVSVRRETPLNERIVTFTDNNILDEESQNLSALQVFYVVQEIRDSQYWLLDQMQTFIDLKDLIYEILNRIDNLDSGIQKALALLTETKQLVADIDDTYQDLQNQVNEGVKCNVTHNLFAIEQYDKVLQGDEATGWGYQGTTHSSTDYPTAYETLLNEYETGTPRIYISDDLTTYYKSYTGSTTGNFYLPSNETLAVGSTVYSDVYCTTSAGEVTALSSLTAAKYNVTGGSTFYINNSTILNTGVTVYQNALLTTSGGTVTGLKSVSANKYTLSTSGVVYCDGTIAKNKVLYSDAALTTSIGTVTNIGTTQSDKYNIKGASFSTFYVPKGTVLQANTKLYSDAVCSVQIGTISSKGTISTGTAYCYESNGTISLAGHTTYFPTLFYTKTALAIGQDYTTIYTNSACTATSYSGGGDNMYARVKPMANSGDIYSALGKTYYTSNNNERSTFSLSYKAKSTVPASTSTYYMLQGSSTKCTITKQSTVTATSIKVNNGTNQSYSAGGTVSGNYIKIDSDSYKSYNKIGAITNATINIDDGAIETLTDNGIQTASGIVFEFREASNGHFIADSKYTDAIEAVIGNDGWCPVYIINQETGTFTLPVLVNDTYIAEKGRPYFCIGNTVLIMSDMSGVTKTYLDSVLSNYLNKTDNEYLSLKQLVLDFYSVVGEVNNSLAELLGE